MMVVYVSLEVNIEQLFKQEPTHQHLTERPIFNSYRVTFEINNYWCLVDLQIKSSHHKS
jgi:hypothetical protein